MLSMLNPRTSGCVTLRANDERICGENVVKALFVVSRDPSQPDAVLRAPLQRLLDAQRVEEPVVDGRQALAASQKVVVRGVGACLLKVVRQSGRPCGLGL